MNDSLSIVYATRMQSKRETFYATLAGRRQPTYATSGGRACLALLPDEEVDDILSRSVMTRLTPKTETDPATVRAAIEQSRADGYCLGGERDLAQQRLLTRSRGPKHGVALREAAGRGGEGGLHARPLRFLGPQLDA